MKESKVKLGGIWSLITAIVITAMLCGTAVYISGQHNQTQKDISDTQAKATEHAGGDIGRGLCTTSTRAYTVCTGFGE